MYLAEKSQHFKNQSESFKLLQKKPEDSEIHLTLSSFLNILCNWVLATADFCLLPLITMPRDASVPEPHLSLPEGRVLLFAFLLDFQQNTITGCPESSGRKEEEQKTTTHPAFAPICSAPIVYPEPPTTSQKYGLNECYSVHLSMGIRKYCLLV